MPPRYTTVNADDIKIGFRLRMARMERGFTQGQIAEIFGVSSQQFQKFESGLNRISAKLLHRLSSVLERPLEWFLQDLEHEQTLVVEEKIILEDDPLPRYSFSKLALKSLGEIKDPKIQRQLLLLIQLVAEAITEGKERAEET